MMTSNIVEAYWQETALTAIMSIDNAVIYTFTKNAMRKLSVWHLPAAQHEGHHPPNDLIEGGMTKHMFKVYLVTSSLCEAEDIGGITLDCLKSAAAIHDIGKYGLTGTDVKIDPYHALLVRKIADQGSLSDQIYEFIIGLVESHMGRWGKYPTDTCEKRILHYADMISARYVL